MTQPTPKPAATRAPATWTVFETIEHAYVHIVSDDETPIATDVTVLVVRGINVVAPKGVDACWKVAEGDLRDRATSDDPPVLCASRNGTAHGLTEARPYALKPTVERVRS